MVLLHYIISENVISLYMHSNGEDVFDSLSYSANEIAKILYKKHHDVSIKWTEHPHRRHYLKNGKG